MRKMPSPTKLIAYVASLILIPSFLSAAPPNNQTNMQTSAAKVSAGSKASAKADEKRLLVAYGNLPLAFEKNLGQTDPQVQFLSRGNGYSIFLTPQETVLALRRKAAEEKSSLSHIGFQNTKKDNRENDSVIRIQMQGANPAPQVTGLDKLPGKTDYFTGNDPKNWHTDVPSFARVQYRDVYPGINQVFYGNHRQFEYDYVVNPAADPKAIALHVAGARKLSIDRDGNLVMSLDNGSVEMRKPVAYQTVNNERREVAARYALTGKDRVSFALGSYDKSQALVIDPVLNYSTYLGGSDTNLFPAGDAANSIAVDGTGNAYITGGTFSPSFPSGGYPSTLNPNGSVFVTEINPTATAVLYSTYLGGTGPNGEYGLGIAVDPSPSAACLNASSAPGICAYVTGNTSSTDFPTPNGLNTSPLSLPPGSSTAFVSKINPAITGLSSLVYSSYIAGTNGDVGNAIAVDINAMAYITGYTNSATWPVAGGGSATVNGYSSVLNSSSGNAFLIKINTTLSGTASLAYSTYLGGSGTGSNAVAAGDSGSGVAVDTSQNAYITGVTTSSDFPTPGTPYQGQFPNMGGNAVFVARINTTLTGTSSLIYSTYLANQLAAPTNDIGSAIALGPGNVAYVTGQTSSSAFPVTEPGSTPGQFPSPPSGAGVAFVSVIDTTQPGTSSLTFSALLGGTSGDNGLGIRVGSQGDAYIAGVAASTDFPLTSGAFQQMRPNGNGDAFIAEIAPHGNGASDLVYSTYFGGDGAGGSYPDRAYGIALDSANNVYIAGQTQSEPSTFPVFSSGGTALQTTLGPSGFAAGFVAKLTLIPTVTVSPTTLTFTNQVVGVTSTPQTVTLTNNSHVSLTISAPPAPSTGYGITANNCVTSVAPGGSCSVGVTFTPTVSPTQNGTLTFTDSNSINGLDDTSSPQTVALNGTSIAAIQTVQLSQNSLTFSSQTLHTNSTPQTVTITNNGNAPITMSSPSISLAGADPGDYGQMNTCDGATLQPPPSSSSSCTVTVTFTPTAANSRTATLSIADDATGTPQSVSLTGTGTSLTQTVGLSSTTLTFSGQVVGTMSAAQMVTVTNNGTGAVTMSSPSISIAPTGEFTETNTCDGATLQPSTGSCTITVKFMPTSANNPRTATLSIADDATGGPQTVSLTGTGLTQTVSLSASTVTFPSQVVNTVSTAQTVTVSNNGTAAVTMSSPSISINPTGEFTQTNTCDGATLQPSTGSCTISVKFTPTSANNPRTATLSIADNATGSPQTVSLTGTGAAVVNTIGLSSSTVTFSSQTVGTTSTGQMVTVTANGNTAVIMASPAATASGDFQVSATTCSGMTLQPNGTCTVTVTFSPSATGARTGSLSVSSNASNNPQTANLTGTGSAAAAGTVTVTPTTGLTFSSQAVNTTSPAQMVTVTNSGSVPVIFNATAATTTAPFAVSASTCNGATLQASNACTISVTFTPTSTTSPQNGTLSIADNASGNPQTVSLTGTVSTSGTDFGFNLPSTSFTATPGVPLSFTINLVSTGGFNTPVTFTCTTNIPQGSCQAPASPVTPTAAPGTAASFIILTKAAFVSPTSSVRTPPISKQQILLLAMAALMLFLIPATRKLRLRLGLAGAMVLFALLAGCSNPPPNSSTPAGSYTVTITGTAGTVTHSSTINVAVN
jgi:hypothetical protein